MSKKFILKFDNIIEKFLTSIEEHNKKFFVLAIIFYIYAFYCRNIFPTSWNFLYRESVNKFNNIYDVTGIFLIIGIFFLIIGLILSIITKSSIVDKASSPLFVVSLIILICIISIDSFHQITFNIKDTERIRFIQKNEPLLKIIQLFYILPPTTYQYYPLLYINKGELFLLTEPFPVCDNLNIRYNNNFDLRKIQGILLKKASNKFKLLPAEKALLKAVEKGKNVHLQTKLNNICINAFLNYHEIFVCFLYERTIRKEVISWLCSNKDAACHWSNYGLNVYGAYIIGELDLSNLSINHQLSFINCCFMNKLVLRNAELPELTLTGCQLLKGFNGEGLQIKGNLLLDRGFKCRGNFRINLAKISGRIRCESAKLDAKGEVSAFLGDYIEVTESLVFRHSPGYINNWFHSSGNISLKHAKIGGDLEFKRCKIYPNNSQRIAISASHIEIGGSLRLTDGFYTEGRILFNKALIEGNFEMNGITRPEVMELDLSHSHIELLADKKFNWPEKGKLFINGLKYNNIKQHEYKKSIYYVGENYDPNVRLNWIRRNYSQMFNPQPYDQLAKVYLNEGRKDYHDKVMIAKYKDYYENHNNFIKDVWSGFWRLIFCYGYCPFRIIVWDMVIIILGALLFCRGYKEGKIIQANKFYSEEREVKIRFTPFFYSLDVFLPIINLDMQKNWKPIIPHNSLNDKSFLRKYRRMIKVYYLYLWYVFQIVSGWILNIILITVLTGLIKF